MMRALLRPLSSLRHSPTSSRTLHSSWTSCSSSSSTRSVLRNVWGSHLSTAAPAAAPQNDTPPPAGVPTERVSEIVDEITGLTLMEVADLTELLRTKLGVEMPAMAVMMPGMGPAGVGGSRGKGGGAAAAVEKKEKTAFDLKLEGFDAAAKIKVIKEVRSFTDLGLKEAKELVEKAPAVLKKGVPKEEAEKIVEKMKEVGAKVVME